MSYTKQNWVNGDIITADKLNHIEDGIEGGSGDGGFIITVTPDENWENFTADKTFAEIKSAFDNGQIMQVNFGDSSYADILLLSSIDEGTVFFSNIAINSGILVYQRIKINSSDTVTFYNYEKTLG